MLNKSLNFIRGLNRTNVYFQSRSVKFGDVLGVWELGQNARSISPKLCLLGPKNSVT